MASGLNSRFKIILQHTCGPRTFGLDCTLRRNQPGFNFVFLVTTNINNNNRIDFNKWILWLIDIVPQFGSNLLPSGSKLYLKYFCSIRCSSRTFLLDCIWYDVMIWQDDIIKSYDMTIGYDDRICPKYQSISK